MRTAQTAPLPLQTLDRRWTRDKNVLMPDLPTTEKSSSSWRALSLTAALWLVALFALYEGAGKILRYLLPGTDDDLGLFLCHGQAFFLALFAPLMLKASPNRWRAAGEAAAFILIALSPLAVGFALSSRITPLTAAAACRGAVCLAAFALLCFALWTAAERWYFSLQALAAGAGPLAAFFLGELADLRGTEAAGLKTLCSLSVFCALTEAMQRSAPPPAMSAWTTSAILWLLAAAVCFVLQPRQTAV